MGFGVCMIDTPLWSFPVYTRHIKLRQFQILFFPYHSFVSGILFMTIVTRIIQIAAFKFNGHYIQYTVIMAAAGLVVNNFSFYRYAHKKW